MPLLPLESFQADVVCPRCRRSTGLYCSSCLLDFAEVQGKPILVDFDNSVLVQSQSRQSLIPRAARGRLQRWAIKILEGENEVAREQVLRFVDLAAKVAQGSRPRILIVGGAAIGNGISELYTRADLDLIAFDIYSSPHVQIVADGHSVPLRNHCVDGVIIQAVLEHVVAPHIVVSEIERVLRPGGVVYADTPFLQQVHEGPYDFCRFTESGHRYLFKNFTEHGAGPVGGLGKQMVWSIDYLFRGLFRSRLAGRIGRAMFFWIRWLDAFIPVRYAVDGAPGCFFLGTLSERAITPKELIERYKGAQVRN